MRFESLFCVVAHFPASTNNTLNSDLCFKKLFEKNSPSEKKTFSNLKLKLYFSKFQTVFFWNGLAFSKAS